MRVLRLALVACLSVRVARAQVSAIAGYQPASDVSQFLLLDLDVRDLESSLATAYQSYSEGGNSFVNASDGSVRTIQSLSTNTADLAGDKWFEVYKNYWEDELYADTFTSNACKGEGDFSASVAPPVGPTSREEGCSKGAVLMCMWMYVIRQLEAGVKECVAGSIPAPSGWDAAVAVYAGSLVGARGGDRGLSVHSVAEKRCSDFDTCDSSIAELSGVDFDAAVNRKIYDQFSLGQQLQRNLSCDALAQVKERVVQLMAVPLIQGTLKYLYYSAQPEASEGQRAELWAFSSAVLPYLHSHSPSTAALLRRNAYMLDKVAVPDGFRPVLSAVQAMYPTLGIECKDVGGLASTAYSSGYFPGMEPCGGRGGGGKDKEEGVPVYGIALAVVFSVLGCACILGMLFYFVVRPWRNKRTSSTALNHEDAQV